MNNEQSMVRDFHAHFELSVGRRPCLKTEHFDSNEPLARIALITEEVGELAMALANGNEVAVADAIGDVLYTVYGCAVENGIDMEPVFAEIHRSNMTKELNPDGWKIRKGKDFSPANLAPIINEQWDRALEWDKQEAKIRAEMK